MPIKQFLMIFMAATLTSGCSSDDDNGPGGKDPGPGPGTTIEKGLIYTIDFEGDNPFENLTEKNPDLVVADDPYVEGNKVGKATLRRGEYRTETIIGKDGIHYFFADSEDELRGEELWVGFRVCPMFGDYDATNNYPSLFQIGPINNPTTYPGETSAGHFQLTYNTLLHKWRLRKFDTQYAPGYSAQDNICDAANGRWQDVVMHCRFRSDAQGLMEIWHNGVKVYEHEGVMGIPFSRTRFQFGIYIGADNVANTDLVCYFDDIKVGGAGATYETVAPEERLIWY